MMVRVSTTEEEADIVAMIFTILEGFGEVPNSLDCGRGNPDGERSSVACLNPIEGAQVLQDFLVLLSRV